MVLPNILVLTPSGTLQAWRRVCGITRHCVCVFLLAVGVKCSSGTASLRRIGAEDHVPQNTKQSLVLEGIGLRRPISAWQCDLRSATGAAEWGAASSLFPPPVARGRRRFDVPGGRPSRGRGCREWPREPEPGQNKSEVDDWGNRDQIRCETRLPGHEGCACAC